jgi:hypothetical protein
MYTHFAVEQAIGYIYQLRAAMYFILKSEDYNSTSKYIIEGLDDIQVDKNGEVDEVVQLKHHINKKANLTDSSVDLWKSLKIWIELYNEDLISKDTKIYLITTSTATTNSIAYYLVSAD